MKRHNSLRGRYCLCGLLTLVLLVSSFMPTAMAEELHVWDWWGVTTQAQQDWWKHVETTFEERHPGVDFQFLSVAGVFGLFDRLVAASASGIAPDVSQVSVAFARGAYEAGLLRPLNDFIAKTPELQPQNFVPVASIFNQKDGQIYGIPHNIDANALVYNVDLFDEAGLDSGVYAIDDWDTFRDYAQKLTRLSSGGEVIRTGYATTFGMLPFSNWLYANGGGFYDADYQQLEVASEAGIEALEFLVELQTLGQVLPPGSGNPLASGRAAMYLGGSFHGHIIQNEAPDLNFKVTSLPPGPNATERAVTGWVNMISIPSGAKNPELAWEYIKYYTGLQGQEDIIKVHNRPGAPRYDLYQSSTWENAVREYPYLETLPDVFQRAKPYPFIQYTDLNEIFAPLMTQVANGEISPRHALEEAQRRGNAVLEGSN